MTKYKIGDIIVHPFENISAVTLGYVYKIEKEKFTVCWYVMSGWIGDFSDFKLEYDNTNEVFLLYTDSMAEEDTTL